MRLRRIQARGFLSFDGFDLTLADRITLIVGPNGHGKSNLGHVLRLVYAAVSSADRSGTELERTLALYLAGRRVGAGTDRTEVRLDFELTEDLEKQVVLAYLQAAIAYALIGNTSGYETSAIDAWIERQVTLKRIAPLLLATIVVSHSGLPDAQWQVALEFESVQARGRSKRYRWLLRGSPSVDSIVGLDDVDTPSIPGQALADRLHGKSRSQGSRPAAPGGLFSFARLLPRAHQAVSCSLDLGNTPSIHMRRFSDLIGVDPTGQGDNNHHYGFSRVLHVLLKRAVRQETDVRFSIPSHGAESTSDPRPRDDLGRLAERLFLLKNGRSAERAGFDRVVQRFGEFANGRQVDVSAQQSPGGDGAAVNVELQLLVSIAPVAAGDRGPVAQVPIEFAGAGAGEALLLAFALESPRGSVLVLDEPAATLHPSMQRALSSRIAAGEAQFVVITHSPYLVPYNDVAVVQLCRFELDDDLRTQPWQPAARVLMKAAPKVAAKGNQGLPFASRVILCEGQSDVAFVNALADRFQLSLEDTNINVLDCGGRENLPDYIQLAAGLGVHHFVVMDADATKARKDPSVARKAQAVRDAVERSERSQLFEFPEDLEDTLGIEKQKTFDARNIVEGLNLDDLVDIRTLHDRLVLFAEVRRP